MTEGFPVEFKCGHVQTFYTTPASNLISPRGEPLWECRACGKLVGLKGWRPGTMQVRKQRPNLMGGYTAEGGSIPTSE